MIAPPRRQPVIMEDEARAAERWNRAASRLHANRDFQLNSQSLVMCLTPEKCLGARRGRTSFLTTSSM